MSGATDSGMFKTMGVVIGSLTGLAIIIVVTAQMLGNNPDDPDDPLMRDALADRIGPVATVRISADDLPAGGAAATVADAGPKTGADLVAGACAACHVAGVAGAPKVDDEAAWAARRETGLDALVASVINGKGSMPARGGSTYTDEEIKLAVQVLAMFEVDEAEAAPAAEEATAPAADAAAAPAGEAAAPAADTEAVPAEGEADAPAADAEAAPAEEAPAATEEKPADDTTSDTGGALVVGQVPEGVTDEIKASVDAMCSTCHVAGVGGAPKNGDTAAWQERADKGLAALTSSVINGLGVMPPRGASTLTDEQIPLAIQYLMSK